MITILVLITVGAVACVVWAALGAEDTAFDNETREPVFIPAQRPGGER